MSQSTLPSLTTADAVKADSAFRQWWYYSIELLPGLFTPGQKHDNIIPVRTLLEGAPIEDRRCLDIGPMEGMMSLLMLRRGASSVTAIDRFNCADKINFIQRCHNTHFDYLHGVELRDLAVHVKALNRYPFDFVLFAGVLYHMLDPLAGLVSARAMVRDGGLMLIETAAINDPQMAQWFNANGIYYDYPYGSNYWFTSVACLEYLCRFLRLKPLDCAYVSHGSGNGLHEVVRCAIVCRAEGQAVALPGDDWMKAQDEHDNPGAHEVARNYENLLDWKELRTNQPALPYTPHSDKLVYHQETEIVDVYKSLNAMGPLRNDDEEKLILKLEHRI